MEDPAVRDRLFSYLTVSGVTFRTLRHPPTATSEESAQARGEPLECGAKALVVRTDTENHLLVIPAHRKLSSKLVRQALGVKQFRFATADELAALTGLIPGAVPPFGEPILPLSLTADPEVGAVHGRVAFNAGTREDSVIMSTEDWKSAAQPTFAPIAEPAA